MKATHYDSREAEEYYEGMAMAKSDEYMNNKAVENQYKCRYCGNPIENDAYQHLSTGDYYCDNDCIKAEITKRWAVRGNSLSSVTKQEYDTMLSVCYDKVCVNRTIKEA